MAIVEELRRRTVGRTQTLVASESRQRSSDSPDRLLTAATMISIRSAAAMPFSVAAGRSLKPWSRMMLTRCQTENAVSWRRSSASPFRYTENGFRMLSTVGSLQDVSGAGPSNAGAGRGARRLSRQGMQRAPERAFEIHRGQSGRPIDGIDPVGLGRLAAGPDRGAAVAMSTNSSQPCHCPDATAAPHARAAYRVPSSPITTSGVFREHFGHGLALRLGLQNAVLADG